MRAIEQHGEQVAKAAVLRWLGGLDHAAIAEQLNTDEATVERCLQLARTPPPRLGDECRANQETGAGCCRQA